MKKMLTSDVGQTIIKLEERLPLFGGSHLNHLNEIMSTEEASKLWGVHQDHVKRLCREGKVTCRKIGKTYILNKDQPRPGLKKAVV
jgi:excisionase family DNA binding protein